MSSQLQSWIQSAKLSKYENILIEEIGEMDVVGMLTEDDVKEIAKKCGMNIGKRRLFLTAVQKVKNETRKNETTIPVQVRKIDTKRVQDVIREITLKYEFEALNLLGFARKLIQALIKHPNQRLKLTEKKYESEIVVPGLEVLLVNIVGLMKLKRGDGHIYLSIVDPEVDDRSTLKITSGVEKPLSQVRNVMDIEIEKLKFVSHAFEQRTSSTETEMAREGVRKMLREKLEALQKTIREEKLRAASPDVQTSREWKIVPPLTPHRLHLLKQVSDTSEDNMADFIEQSAKERVEAGLQTRVSQDEPTKTTNTTSTTFSTSHSRKVENLEQRLTCARKKTIQVQYELPKQWKVRCKFDYFESTQNVYEHFKKWLLDVSSEEECTFKLVPRGKASKLVADHLNNNKSTFFDIEAGNNRLRFVVKDLSSDRVLAEVGKLLKV